MPAVSFLFPDLVVESRRGGREYIKVFRENGTRYFLSVAYKMADGLNVIVTATPQRAEQIKNAIESGKMLFMRTALDASVKAPPSKSPSTDGGRFDDTKSIRQKGPTSQEKSEEKRFEVKPPGALNLSLKGAIDFGHASTTPELFRKRRSGFL